VAHDAITRQIVSITRKKRKMALIPALIVTANLQRE